MKKLIIMLLLISIHPVLWCLDVKDFEQEVNTKFDINYRNCEEIGTFVARRLYSEQFSDLTMVGIYRKDCVIGHRIVTFRDKWGDLYLVTSPWKLIQEPKVRVIKVMTNNFYDAIEYIYKDWDRLVLYDHRGNKIGYHKRGTVQ